MPTKQVQLDIAVKVVSSVLTVLVVSFGAIVWNSMDSTEDRIGNLSGYVHTELNKIREDTKKESENNLKIIRQLTLQIESLNREIINIETSFINGNDLPAKSNGG